MSDPTSQPIAYFLQEQRVTNLKQNDLIIAQQQMIDTLARILTENGLGEILDTNGVSKFVEGSPNHNTSASRRKFGPTSAPLIWSGEIEDPIPVEIGGVLTKARIMTDKDTRHWNRLLDLNIKIREQNSQVEEETINLEHYEKNLQFHEDKILTDAETEAELRLLIQEIPKKCFSLQCEIDKYRAEVENLMQELSLGMLHFMENSKLRKEGGTEPLFGGTLRILQKDTNTSFITTDLADSDSSSRSESTVVPQKQTPSGHLVKFQKFHDVGSPSR